MVIEINLKANTQNPVDKHTRIKEIEEMKREVQEVLQFIKKTKRTIEKLQKHNKVRLFEGTEEHSGLETVNSNEIQIISVEFDNNISWGTLENLTESKYNTLSDNDKSFVKLVKSLFFPKVVSIKDLLSDKSSLMGWKEHIRNLRSIIETKKGIPFGEYLFKENLKFSKKIYDSYAKNSLFDKDFDEDYKSKTTRGFFKKHGSEITENIRKRYNLTFEEARVFTIYLACMSDFDKVVLGFDYKTMHEFFQNVWIKINHDQDEFRGKQQITSDYQKVIVHSDFSRFKSSVSLGFDSYFTLLNHNKFELWFSEQKCGTGYSICKTFRNMGGQLHKSVFSLAQKRTGNKFQDLLQRLGFTIHQSIDFSNSLFKRYTYYYDAKGNNFLQKMKSTKYKHDLIFGLERNGIPNAKHLAHKLIKSAKDNHRLIALMQNGYTLNDDAKVVNHLDITNRKKQPIRIMGEIFSFKPLKNEKDDHIISIEGYSEKLIKKLQRTHSVFDSELYYQLNSIFKSISISRNFTITELLSTNDYSENLLSAYNKLLFEIFQYFVNSDNFISFEILKEGKTFVCSEIATEDIANVKLWFEKNQKMYSAIPYTMNYIWKLPFYGKLKEISRNNPTKLSKYKELAFKKLFSYNDKEVLDFLKEITSKDFSEKDFKQKSKANPDYSLIFNILYLLKGNTRLKLRKNLFEQGDTIRSLIFVDEKGNPIRVFENDNDLKERENPILNFKMDFNEIFSINRLLDRNILSTFPIAIKSGKSVTRNSELKFRFCRVDGKRAGEKGKKARELYIERVREKLGHIDEINDLIDILYSKPAISFNLLRGENRESMMKLFIYLFFEYYEVWEEFSISIRNYLKKNLRFKEVNMVSSKNFVNSGWNITLKSVKEDTDKKWVLHYLVRNNNSKVIERKIKIFPAFVNIINKNTNKEHLADMNEVTLFCNFNPLFVSVLSTLENEIMPLISVADKKEIDSRINPVSKNITEWMEKVFV
ncbi:MAG: hypothetical protein GPJ51_12325 [Candidatus Heimdallarchaeota archaeon]|nr:hypothetical protein [Candidatus Heimdallarchaeota archaeon]